jgi:hypothetical protein
MREGGILRNEWLRLKFGGVEDGVGMERKKPHHDPGGGWVVR